MPQVKDYYAETVLDNGETIRVCIRTMGDKTFALFTTLDNQDKGFKVIGAPMNIPMGKLLS